MTKEDTSKPLALHKDYNYALGMFYGLWSSVELTTDYAIWKFLGVTPGQAHLITSGMMFGRKSRLLADLIGRSDNPNKAAILGAFNKVRANKRDVFAHAYLRSDEQTVTFVERSVSGEFTATEHTFTLQQFVVHVAEFSLATAEFYNSLGTTKPEIEEFAKAALSLSRKSTKSPGKPFRKR